MTTKGQQLFECAPSNRNNHRHPELVSGSVLTQQTTDTEMNSA
jgi:hypothetical protein